MAYNSNISSTTGGIIARFFRNPFTIAFLALGFILQTIMFFSVSFSIRHSINLLDVLNAIPFAFSALVVGIFSLLFWALNHHGRTHKSELKCKEIERLFEIRRRAIEKVLSDADIKDTSELALLKAHLLLSAGDLNWEPETPTTSLAFDYGEAVKAVLRRT